MKIGMETSIRLYSNSQKESYDTGHYYNHLSTLYVL